MLQERRKDQRKKIDTPFQAFEVSPLTQKASGPFSFRFAQLLCKDDE